MATHLTASGIRPADRLSLTGFWHRRSQPCAISLVASCSATRPRSNHCCSSTSSGRCAPADRLTEQHDEWAEARRSLGLDILARSHTTTDEEAGEVLYRLR